MELTWIGDKNAKGEREEAKKSIQRLLNAPNDTPYMTRNEFLK
jgi:hypothetical protein